MQGREKPSDIAISAVVAHELFYGAFKSQRVVQNLAIVNALQFEVLEFDKEDARQAGEIRDFLLSKGTAIGPVRCTDSGTSRGAKPDSGHAQCRRISTGAAVTAPGLARLAEIPQTLSNRQGIHSSLGVEGFSP